LQGKHFIFEKEGSVDRFDLLQANWISQQLVSFGRLRHPRI